MSTEKVAGWITEADPASITVLTGAGISTDSGIPDFRGPRGVWTVDPAAEKLSTLQNYLAEPDVRRRAWRARVESPARSAKPNAGHRALVDLERSGRLRALVTQNIDGLHQAAGSSPDRVVEVHGTEADVVCMSCDDRQPAEPVLDRVAAGEADPACLRCGGILKSATISFGQALDPATLDRAFSALEASTLLITVGTSLQVYPVAGLVDVALEYGVPVVIVNAQPTPYDLGVDALIREPISEVLPRLVAGSAGGRSAG